MDTITMENFKMNLHYSSNRQISHHLLGIHDTHSYSSVRNDWHSSKILVITKSGKVFIGLLMDPRPNTQIHFKERRRPIQL